MATNVDSHEFSICLMCEEKSAATIQTLRKYLPPSPYRDDRPHVTLLRGISHTEDLTDEQLILRVKELLKGFNYHSAGFVIRRAFNGRFLRYGTTSVFLMKLPNDMRLWRRRLIRNLRAEGFRVELRERLLYFPHVTLRLGVPIRRQQKRMMKQQNEFPQELTFSGRAIFRIYYESGKRLVHEVNLN